tara:strand:- start:1648 stop:1824 length:177 start_codon:yes stop_codon:yes gene_type:complete
MDNVQMMKKLQSIIDKEESKKTKKLTQNQIFEKPKTKPSNYKSVNATGYGKVKQIKKK